MGNLVRNADGVGGGASAALTAAPAPAPSVLAGAAALADPTPAAAPTAAPALPGSGEEPWYSSMPSNFQTALQAKGWNGLSKDEALTQVLDSYVNLEKLIGADKAGRTVTLPKDDATPEERLEFFKKLGTPEKPEEYGFADIKDLPDTVKPLLTEAQDWMHKAGLPKQMGANLLAEVAKAEVAKAEAWNQQSQSDMNALSLEMGAEFDNKIELARRATRAAGIDQASMLKMEQALGTKQMLKMMMTFGDNLREAEAPAVGNGGAQFQQSSEAAKSEIAGLFQDKDFMANYLSPNMAVRKGAIDKMERLQKIANGG